MNGILMVEGPMPRESCLAGLPIYAAPRIPDTKREIESLEADMLRGEQVECPLKHEFAPGVYVRTVTMHAGTFVIGHEHKTEHFNIVHTGKARVMMDGIYHDIVAPCMFVSKPGVRKVLLIQETMDWSTIHPTTETDLAKLESLLIVKSPSFVKHMEDLERLKLMRTTPELPSIEGSTL